LQECALLRIAVPGQVSVVGCGDLSFARHTSPALSTLRIPGTTIGAVAVAVLSARLAGDPPRGQTIPIKLVVRQSSGPAPN
jgi:DNA-binding LacI/PurR family transcriptional regulator